MPIRWWTASLNSGSTYEILESSDAENVLRIVLNNQVNLSLWCRIVAPRSNALLGEQSTIKWGVRKLYHFCSYLELYMHFWCLDLRNDVDNLARVHIRASRMNKRLEYMPRKNRLKECNLFSISVRTYRAGLTRSVSTYMESSKLRIKFPSF